MTASRGNAVETTTVTFKPSTEPLLNPGKGWVLYGMAEWQDPKALAVGSIGYPKRGDHIRKGEAGRVPSRRWVGTMPW